MCPFERPPGSGVDRLNGFREVARQLGQRAAINIPTVNILIRGIQQDVAVRVRRYSRPLNPRDIIGTGGQVGLETPEESLCALAEEA